MGRGLGYAPRGWKRWPVALIAVLVVILMAVVSGPMEAQSECGSIQARVDGADQGATVDLPDGCVYRETVVIDKPLTLIGGPGVGIRGSDVWTDWNKSGAYWVKGTLPNFNAVLQIPDPQHPYPCKDGTARCLWPEQVIFDGKPLEQVASNPRAGQFAVDDERRVILADDPAGHTVEVTVRQRWIEGQADNVVIDGFAMKHAANGARKGAISNNGHSDWTVGNSDLSHVHGVLVGLTDGTGLKIVGNQVHHGGQLGINSSTADLEVRGNHIHHNNVEAFFPGFSAGGMKTANMNRLLVDGNRVHHNDQVGIWSDIGSGNVTISNNRIHHNVKRGVHLEISDNAKIFGNTIWENGWGVPDTGNPGITVSSSREVEVYDNTLAWNADGISVVNSQRENGVGGSDPIFDTVSNVHVHHNTILAKDYPPVGEEEHLALIWRKNYPGGNIYEPAANNRGYDNRYWYPQPEGNRYRFLWDVELERLAAFNRTLGEARGRYLSDAEKEQVVRAKKIPANPER